MEELGREWKLSELRIVSDISLSIVLTFLQVNLKLPFMFKCTQLFSFANLISLNQQHRPPCFVWLSEPKLKFKWNFSFNFTYFQKSKIFVLLLNCNSNPDQASPLETSLCSSIVSFITAGSGAKSFVFISMSFLLLFSLDFSTSSSCSLPSRE